MKSKAPSSDLVLRPNKGHVYYQETFAGTIEEQEGQCVFTYDPAYIESPNAQPISLTLPLRSEPYIERTMIPFFDGLIPEGWVLDIAIDNWKLDRRDRMGLLLTVCEDCIGAVSIYAEGRTPKWKQDKPKKKTSNSGPARDKTAATSSVRSTRCLSCFEKISSEESSSEYHRRCSFQLFGTRVPPRADFTLEDTVALAAKNVLSRTAVTGVQPKLSLDLDVDSVTDRALKRLTVVGLWGRFILKPPSSKYPEMPVVESATMRMAQLCGIPVAEHGLIRLKSGELAYVARRFDRFEDKKLPMEDACQLSELLTEKKYKSSMEKTGKLIGEFSSFSGLDVIRFYEIALFSFLTGNADMHLKNFSLLTREDGRITLSPAYDLLSTQLLVPDDQEEMALTVNGKKAKLKRTDFIALAATLSITPKARDNAIKRIITKIPVMHETIESSFMSNKMKDKLRQVIETRAEILEAE